MRQRYAKEGTCGVQDGGFYAGSVGQPHIKEHVLQRGLAHAQCAQLKDLLAAESPKGLAAEYGKHQQQCAGAHKPIAGKNELCSYVVSCNAQ